MKKELRTHVVSASIISTTWSGYLNFRSFESLAEGGAMMSSMASPTREGLLVTYYRSLVLYDLSSWTN